MTGLPCHAYADAAWLARERREVLAKSWTAIASRAQVAEAGDLLGTECAGVRVLLARDRTGVLRGFHNVCSHRGALLLEGEAHRQPSIACPYHCWTYALDGRLIATPDVGGHGRMHADEIDPGALGLKPIRIAEWGGLVFGDLGGEGAPLEQHLAPLRRRWTAYGFEGLVHGGSAQCNVEGNWKLVLENFVESYHLPWVHPDLNTYSRSEDHYDVIEPPLLIGQGNRTAAPPALDGKLRRFPNLPPAAERQGEFLLIFPNGIAIAMPDHYATLVVTPVSPERTVERFDFWFLPEAETEAVKAARQAVIDRWLAINTQDIAIVRRLQLGRASPAFDGGVLTQHWERPVAAFQGLLRERLREM
jgi:phenylpropionate dioxygenase-like ring-hydroxylating dioxygenase large terminal subunit